jgi:hypothetical protein
VHPILVLRKDSNRAILEIPLELEGFVQLLSGAQLAAGEGHCRHDRGLCLLLLGFNSHAATASMEERNATMQ